MPCALAPPCLLCGYCSLAEPGSTWPTRAAQVDADAAALEPRLARLEASEAASPKAPLRLVAAVEEKVEGLAAQQARRTRVNLSGAWKLEGARAGAAPPRP